MKRPDPKDEIQHLLGGYAAGTLTPAEQKRLFDAAMEDQTLFDAMADEQALKELLDDPEARGYLRAALDEQPKSASAWWPKAAGFAAVAAMLAVGTFVGLRQWSVTGAKNESAGVSNPVEVAQAPAPMAAPPPPPSAAAEEEIAKSKQAAPNKVVNAVVPAPKPVAAPEADAVSPAESSLKEAKKAETEIATANAPPAATRPPAVPVPMVRVEPREQELAKAAPPPQALSARSSLSLQVSASQLFLTQYRQNFLPTSNAGGSFQTLGRMRDSAAPAQRKQSSAETQQRNQAPAEDRLSQRAGGAAASANGPVSNRGIRYQILRRNSQGNFVQTRLDTRFEAGDEIQLQIEKNAPGFVNVFKGSATVPIANESASSAMTVPLRLTAGTLDLSIVFAEAPTGLQVPIASQLTEQSGNLMYVVLPGPLPNPVVAKLRVTVYQP